MRAAGAKTLPSALRYYRSFDLLIIDEFGFDKLEHREYPESPSTTETAAKQAAFAPSSLCDHQFNVQFLHRLAKFLMHDVANVAIEH